MEIKIIVIEGGVISISDYAFEGCTSLSSVSIPNGLTTIGYAVFSGCSNLESIVIPISYKNELEGIEGLMPWSEMIQQRCWIKSKS